MRRSDRSPDGGEPRDREPGLFDLPLDPPPATPATNTRAVEKPAEAPRPRPKPAPVPVEAEELPLAPLAGGRPPATVRARLTAGAADLLVHTAVAVSALAGSRALGAQPALSDWPAVAVFLASFSFLYTVVPLAFWGQTLGMAWAGLLARSRDGEALSFDQTARLWLGGLLTATTLGLPLFLTGTGRSLADRLSGADTYLTS